MNDRSIATHPDLDLPGRIRPGLDILANVIVIALKSRTRYKQNNPVYEPGLVESDDSQSLLDYELQRIEQCHAELGRYTYANQSSFSDVSEIKPIIRRVAPVSPVRPMQSNVGERIIDFYLHWIQDACTPGANPDTYGETVTADVTALLAIMERVNLGKFVAESKFVDLKAQFMGTGGEREAMIALISRPDREVSVLELAQSLAAHYDINSDQIVRMFQFMIATTIDIEVDYLRLRIAEST